MVVPPTVALCLETGTAMAKWDLQGAEGSREGRPRVPQGTSGPLWAGGMGRVSSTVWFPGAQWQGNKLESRQDPQVSPPNPSTRRDIRGQSGKVGGWDNSTDRGRV